MLLGMKKNDLFMLQVRLFRAAQLEWNLSAKECSALFNRYNIYDYIKDCYGFYHIQGDATNLADIKNFLLTKGWTL